MSMKINNTQRVSAKELITFRIIVDTQYIILCQIPSYQKLHHIDFNFIDSANDNNFAQDNMDASTIMH